MWSTRKTRISQWAVVFGVALATAGIASNVATTRPAKSAIRKPTMSGSLSRGAKPVAPPAKAPALSVKSPPPPDPAVIALPARPAPTRIFMGNRDGKTNDDKEILIIQALDQPASLKIQNQPIPEAVRLLSENTGVPIEFDRFVIGCLPYGTKTQITANIHNQPLRDCLSALLKPLACKFGLDHDKIVIQARPALFRICRRATWEEVALIEKLYSMPWSKALADTLKFQFMDVPSDAAEANRQKVLAVAASVGSGTFARVLDIACEQFGWVWHPEAGTIAICTKVRQIDRSMGRLVTVQYSEVQLKDVLLDLAQRAGILLKMEPGVLASLPAQQSERFRLTLENVSIRQAFELVAGETGLGFVVESDGIRITPIAAKSPGSGRSSTTDAASLTLTKSANPVVGQVPISGMNGAVWFIREEDLPPDVNRMRLEQLRRAGESIRVAESRPAE